MPPSHWLLACLYVQVVDMVLLRQLGEVEAPELDQDPLLVLRCGHAFLTSTLDGCLGLGRYYEAEEGQEEGGLPRWAAA